MRAIGLARFLLLAVGFIGAASAAGTGLQVDPDEVAWPRWKIRLHVGLATPGPTASEPVVPRSARLLGDYYFSRPRLGAHSSVRLTSGLLVGPRDALFDPASQPASLASILRPGLASFSRSGGTVAQIADSSADSVVARPYLGVGYSVGDSRVGWGFSADLGLAAQNPSAIRLGRVIGGQSLDDLLRELRLQPVLQLGVGYAF